MAAPRSTVASATTTTATTAAATSTTTNNTATTNIANTITNNRLKKFQRGILLLNLQHTFSKEKSFS